MNETKAIISMMMLKRTIRFFILSAVLAGLIVTGAILYHGRNDHGVFVLTIDPHTSNGGISITEQRELNHLRDRLSVHSMIPMTGHTYASLNIDDTMHHEGQWIDPESPYLSYRFFLVNTGLETIDVSYYMRLTAVDAGMDDYIRVLIIEDDESYRMYQKKDSTPFGSLSPTYDQMPTGIEFLSDRIVFREHIVDFTPTEVKSFRVLIWAESQDPDLETADVTGRVKAFINFTVDLDSQISIIALKTLLGSTRDMWIGTPTICNVELEVYHEPTEDA